MTIDIIGAGIGGLTTAIALKQKGFTIRIFEQAPEIKEVGAGIILANNAMQVYDKLGLRGKMEAVGNPLESMNITRGDLRPLSKFSLQVFEEKYGVRNTAIHRGILQQILAGEIQPDELYLGKKLSHVENGEEIILHFEDGSQHESGAVIAADGIHSAVRNSLFPTSVIRRAYQICWRGVVNMELPEEYQHEFNEAWGKGDRVGFGMLSPGKVYWYALKNYSEKYEGIEVEQLGDHFAHFHPLLKKMIDQTAPEAIHTTEITDLKPVSNWVNGQICLMGDAAHATTPNMGQGACQAIEDAWILAECMAKYSLPEAFHKFEQLRIDKAHLVVNTSWRLGKLAQVENSVVASIRNFILKMTPSRMAENQSAKIFELATV